MLELKMFWGGGSMCRALQPAVQQEVQAGDGGSRLSCGASGGGRQRRRAGAPGERG